MPYPTKYIQSIKSNRAWFAVNTAVKSFSWKLVDQTGTQVAVAIFNQYGSFVSVASGTRQYWVLPNTNGFSWIESQTYGEEFPTVDKINTAFFVDRNFVQGTNPVSLLWGQKEVSLPIDQAGKNVDLQIQALTQAITRVNPTLSLDDEPQAAAIAGAASAIGKGLSGASNFWLSNKAINAQNYQAELAADASKYGSALGYSSSVFGTEQRYKSAIYGADTQEDIARMNQTTELTKLGYSSANKSRGASKVGNTSPDSISVASSDPGSFDDSDDEGSVAPSASSDTYSRTSAASQPVQTGHDGASTSAW